MTAKEPQDVILGPVLHTEVRVGRHSNPDLYKKLEDTDLPVYLKRRSEAYFSFARELGRKGITEEMKKVFRNLIEVENSFGEYLASNKPALDVYSRLVAIASPEYAIGETSLADEILMGTVIDLKYDWENPNWTERAKQIREEVDERTKRSGYLTDSYTETLIVGLNSANVDVKVIGIRPRTVVPAQESNTRTTRFSRGSHLKHKPGTLTGVL